jgi:hypothetical protein
LLIIQAEAPYMSQNDDQNRDRENQSEGFEDPSSEESRQSRTGSTEDSPSQQDQGSASRSDQGADLEDTDEMDDDDRDDDSRPIGGANRRRSIS